MLPKMLLIEMRQGKIKTRNLTGFFVGADGIEPPTLPIIIGML